MCWFKKKNEVKVPVLEKPVIPAGDWSEVPVIQILNWADAHQLHWMESGHPNILKPQDTKYWYTKHEHTIKMFKFCYRVLEALSKIYPDVIKMPAYWKERFDCENFSGLVKSLMAWIFGHNTVGIIIGNKENPFRAHVYIAVRTDRGWFAMEPQLLKNANLVPFKDWEWTHRGILL